MADIVHGALFLGAGGGGPKSMADNILKQFTPEQPVFMVGLDDVADEATAVVASFLGSPEAAAAKGKVEFKSPQRAIEALANAANKPVIDYIVPVEIGAVNSLIPALVAARMGVPVVDADGAGRAVPTIACLTFGTCDDLLHDGVAMANETDQPNQQQTALFKVNKISEAGEMASAVVQTDSYSNLGGLALWMMTGKQLKQLAIPGGISHSRRLGEAIRTADKQHCNADLIVDTLDHSGLKARVIAKSLVVQSFEQSTENALDHGKLVLRNQNNVIFTIYIVNENMLAYRSDESAPFILSPDLLCCILPNGQTVDNAELQSLVENTEQEQVVLSLIGVEANSMLKQQPKIIQTFNGIFAQLGYGGQYVPFKA